MMEGDDDVLKVMVMTGIPLRDDQSV